MRFLSLLLIAISIATITCRLKVVSPSPLKSVFPDSGIPYQLAKYGKVPYGSNLVGTLKMAEPEEACSSLLENFQNEDPDVQNLILVVRRGGCKFTVKTRYAQLAGAKMVIVIDEDDSLSSPPLGFDTESITIPTVLIKKSDGDSIVDALKAADNAEANSPDAYVVMSMTFPYAPLSEKVSIDFWFSTADSTAVVYRFLKEFKSFYLESTDSFNFHPHYVTWHCASCEHQGYQTGNPDCLSGGRYCAPDPDNTGGLTGADVVYEDLRQICLWKNFKDLWWDYVEQFSDNCVNKPDQRVCADKALKDVGMSNDQVDSLNRCVQNSFKKSPERYSEEIDQNIDDNELLSQELLLQEEYDVSMFPSLFINHHVYRGEIKEGVTIFKAACESLVEPSELCSQYSGESFTMKIDVGTIVIFSIVLVVIVIIILFFYRRMVRREMNKEMTIQVSQMVSQYFALNENKRLLNS